MKKRKNEVVELSPGGYVKYGDVMLRKFNGTAKIKNCEIILADLLGIPSEAVNLILPSGRRANRSTTLTRLRKNWAKY